MSKNTDVVICLGSSCFARGNKKLLKKVQEYICDNHIEDQVEFRGHHCFGKCNRGPNLKIGECIYEHVSEANLLDILKKELE